MKKDTELKVGDRIRLAHRYGGYDDYTVEEFRQCLGIFFSNDYREAGNFRPLCDLWEEGPDSKEKYIGNYGPYQTNQVPKWMNLPAEQTVEKKQ